MGPNGLSVIGPPNTLTAMVPIILIGLSVDYAIQAVSHYRERRIGGERPLDAVRAGLREVATPLALAGVTTMASFMASLFSPVDMVGDFSVVAAVGVGLSLIVMLTLIPAGRTIIDRRREAKGTLTPPRPISGALPGVESLAELLGREVTRRPAPYIVIVVAAAVALGFAARDLDSTFSIRDLLPRGGSALTDMATVDSAVGGRTEIANLLVKAEATESRTILNLLDMRLAFQDESRRPSAAAGPISVSYEMLIEDWITDSGERGDKYDAELAALFREASAGLRLDPALMGEFLARLEALDPAVGDALVNNPDGIDAMLVQFPASMADLSASRALQREIEALWLGEDDSITATSATIVGLAITDSIKDPADPVHRRYHRRSAGSSRGLLLADAAPAGAGVRSGSPNRLSAGIGTRHHGAVGYPLHYRHVRHSGAVYRHRRGLHDSPDTSLSGRVLSSSQPGAGRYPDALDHRLRAVGFDDDDGARHRGIGGVAYGGVAAVRHNGGYHYLLLADSVRSGSAALDDRLGRVSEYAPALCDRARVGGVGRDDRRDSEAAWERLGNLTRRREGAKTRRGL